MLVARGEKGSIDVTLLAPSSYEPGDGSPPRAQRLADAVRDLRNAGWTVRGVKWDLDPMRALADVWDPRRTRTPTGRPPTAARPPLKPIGRPLTATGAVPARDQAAADRDHARSPRPSLRVRI